MNPCFYCGITMTRSENAAKGGAPLCDTDQTIEHVIPQAMMRIVRDRMSREAQLLNTVAACKNCNTYKGNLSPIDWLVIMPSNEGASRLGELLMKMGCTIDEVAKAMGRRA